MSISFRAENNNFQVPNKSTKYDKNLPLKSAIGSAVLWTGVGLGTDYFVCNKLFKIKSSKKQSLTINGLFGLAMGIYSFFKTKKMQKTENIKNTDDLIENFVNKNS